MHDSAYRAAELFFSNYCEDLSLNNIVIDFGSYDVNGSLRPIFQDKMKYIGIDQNEGPNVDIVCSNRQTPFDSDYADVLVSTSSFEHDPCFWMTFLEMCRVVKPGGYIYINAPSEGPYHGYPGDCWRFYKDSWGSLVSWATEHNYNIQLVQQYIDKSDVWSDNVGIFQKI